MPLQSLNKRSTDRNRNADRTFNSISIVNTANVNYELELLFFLEKWGFLFKCYRS